jgi:drug/metabolite transporter (DMT)-like permease
VIGSFEFTLGETITTVEMLAMALIIVGTSIACVERTEGQKFTIKWRTVGLMLVATFFWATEMVIGKIVILEESVYHSIFWESTFMVCLGVFIWSVSSRSRRRFAIAMKVNKKWIIGLMLVGEAIYAFANSLSAHASEIKEVAIVMLTQPFQAIFVFIFGLLFAKWLPDVFGEITRTKLVQMALATTLAFAGTYLLL